MARVRQVIRQECPLHDLLGALEADASGDGEVTVYVRGLREFGGYGITSDMIDDEIALAVLTAANVANTQLTRDMAIMIDDKGCIKLVRYRSYGEKDGGRTLHMMEGIDLELPPEVEEELRCIVEAQGGRFRPWGLFRFDPLLGAMGLTNCPHCGDIWRARTESPARCQSCQGPLHEGWSSNDVSSTRAPAIAPVLTEQMVREIIDIGHEIVNRDIGYQQGDSRVDLDQKRAGYNSNVKPLVEAFRAAHGGSPNQLIKRRLERYLKKRGLTGCQVDGFSFWGNGYAWPFVWAAITRPRPDKGLMRTQELPQMLVLIGLFNTDVGMTSGVEVGLTHGWHIPQTDPYIARVRAMTQLDPQLDAISQKFGIGMTGMSIRKAWPEIRLTSIIEEYDITTIEDDIEDALDAVLPLFEVVSRV